MQVGSHEVFPVELDGGWAGKVHLAERSERADLASAPPESVTSNDLTRPIDKGWAKRTLCGRRVVAIVTEPGLDLLGDDAGLVCKSCWRSVEGWLSPPPAAEGEDKVVRWIVAAVLETGEAMVEGMPVPRLGPIRGLVRSELKRAIGGEVRTVVVGGAALWVRSGLVIDAKTSEQWQQEMYAAVQRVSAIEAGRLVEPARWRRHWHEIMGT